MSLLRAVRERYGAALVVHAALALYVGVVVLALCLSATWTELMAGPLVLALAFVALPVLRRGLSPFLVLALACPVVLAVAEVTFRVRYFGLDALRYPTRYSPLGVAYVPGLLRPSRDPRLGFELQPGFDGWVKGARLRVNAAGYRDRELARDKPADEYRIAVVGASFTMGSGVADEEVYTRRMELRANALELSKRVRVCNFGVGAYGLGQLVDVVAGAVSASAPDLVLYSVLPDALHELPSMAAPDWDAVLRENRAAHARMSGVRRYSFVVELLPDRGEVLAALHGLWPGSGAGSTVTDAPEPTLLEDSLTRLRELERMGSFDVAVLVLRRMSFGPEHPRLAEHRALAELCGRLGIAVIDTYDAFAPEARTVDQVVYPGDNHPNARSHELYAAAIVEALLSGGFLERR